ncbi:hypothetical protein NUU61_008361 [Penicillium alfredii]|uniref:Glucose-methanol-choline oxidoreductase N-terminal domain-containing protein n=1 Tax=Penicillium alfredii TaxID=1506179 RepID=A0A9W9ESI6_9EURO|nr:uncharacterized protein NUU61_008361 [Penicillium alfredii]KAJ5087054.1 hypothetical protein NUU61_008361 [Penicillium alfredii]
MTHRLHDFAALGLDYLIIGGGTAGLAVAARLSEDPQVQVGVVEAGPSALNHEDGGVITIPGRYGETLGSAYDWQFATVAQPGLGGRSLPWPRGRVLGGTSALNFMAWNRGHRADYDAWIVSPKEYADLYTHAKSIAQKTGRPHDELLARQFSPDSKGRGQIEYLFDLGNWSPYFTSEPGKKYATMLQMLQYPFSRGSIHIPPRNSESAETSPITVDDKPVIDPQYFLGPGEIDRKILAMAQRLTDRICQTPPLTGLVQGRVFPPSDNIRSDDETYGDFVSNYTITDWHPIGTCAMGGRDGAQTGVVDERLRVYGVRGLRVVDASIMPLQVGAHIQATVYAIAEKGAAMIQEDMLQV